MAANNQFVSNFIDDVGTVDVGTKYVTKSYLMDIYQDLTPIGGIATPGLFVCGYNLQGQLGMNDVVHRSTPIQTTAGGTNWKQVSTKNSHIAAIKTDGTLWTWGLNTNGQLGINDRTHRSTPIQTTAGGTNWKQVSVGYFHTTSIKTDGTLWTWGLNNNGQLGINDSTNRSTPIQVTGGGTNWKQVSCAAHTAAIKTDGTLWTWGQNTYGQLGTNDRVHRSTPVQTTAGGTNWQKVSCGYFHTTSIKTDGTLWTWGRNSYGQLGINDIVHRSTPIQTTAGGTNWKQVANGDYNTLTIKTDGTLWTCGYNRFGNLGTNDSNNRSTPVQTVLGGTTWKQVAGGYYHTMAIQETGDTF